jgi:hypothetical protein
MNFFDGETLINTEELLILKKAIDIIKVLALPLAARRASR